MIVDIHMHWLPENLFKDESLLNSWVHMIPSAYGVYARVTTVPGTDKQQYVIEKPKGYENLNYSEIHIDPRGRLEAMDEAKVDKAVLRISSVGEWLTLDVAKRYNDSLAKFVKENPDRFIGIATVPPWGDKAHLYELERCIKDLGFSGIMCSSHYGNLYLDKEEFRPFLKKLNELGVPVCVHHSPLPVDCSNLYEYTNLRREYGRCVEQMTSLGRILFSGLLDEFPNLKLIPTMLAGGFFAYADLLLAKKSRVQEEMERFDTKAGDKIRGYLEHNIFFEVSHPSNWGKAQLECAVKVLGAENLLFGSCYPVRREWLLKGVECVKDLEIEEKEKALILGGNAMRLFNIKG